MEEKKFVTNRINTYHRRVDGIVHPLCGSQSMSSALYKSDLTASELDGAMLSLTDKLKSFQQSLGSDEQAVFQGVLKSASEQMATIEDDGLGGDLPYAKPVQRTVQGGVREKIIALKDGITA